jgi:hypothetical protein
VLLYADLSGLIIGAAIEVQRNLGPGYLESVRDTLKQIAPQKGDSRKLSFHYLFENLYFGVSRCRPFIWNVKNSGCRYEILSYRQAENAKITKDVKKFSKAIL